MQIVNHTPFPSIGWPSIDQKDTKHVTVLSRVKYLFDTLDEDGLWSLKFAQEQEDFFSADIFYDEKKRRVQFESDFVPYKRQADLIINLSENKREYGKCGVDVLRYTHTQSKDTLLKHRSLNKLGFIHRGDKERLQWVGTPDKKWIETRAPKLPKDFSDKHYNAAHPNLQLTQSYFEPGDIIVFHKYLPGKHEQAIMMPGLYLKATLHKGLETHTVLLETDTVIFNIETLDMNENSIYVSYRNRVPTHTKVDKVTFKMTVEEHFIEKNSTEEGI